MSISMIDSVIDSCIVEHGLNNRLESCFWEQDTVTPWWVAAAWNRINLVCWWGKRQTEATNSNGYHFSHRWRNSLRAENNKHVGKGLHKFRRSMDRANLCSLLIMQLCITKLIYYCFAAGVDNGYPLREIKHSFWRTGSKYLSPFFW
jgi:hypothetical protein